MTPKEQAIKLCDMVYHSAMGDKWHPFVIGRAITIAKELKIQVLRYCQPELEKKVIIFWDEVIVEIRSMKLK